MYKNFVNIPTKLEMLKVSELEMKRPPFLYYGTKKELTEQKIKPVVYLKDRNNWEPKKSGTIL